MKHFLIRYCFTDGSPDEWHADIARFVAALDADPVLRGKISYRALRTAGGDYYHLATAADDAAVAALNASDFFAGYADRTERVSGGQVEVTPLELVAETAYRP
jgi:hypothetical protein